MPGWRSRSHWQWRRSVAQRQNEISQATNLQRTGWFPGQMAEGFRGTKLQISTLVSIHDGFDHVLDEFVPNFSHPNKSFCMAGCVSAARVRCSREIEWKEKSGDESRRFYERWEILWEKFSKVEARLEVFESCGDEGDFCFLAILRKVSGHTLDNLNYISFLFIGFVTRCTFFLIDDYHFKFSLIGMASSAEFFSSFEYFEVLFLNKGIQFHLNKFSWLKLLKRTRKSFQHLNLLIISITV